MRITPFKTCAAHRHRKTCGMVANFLPNILILFQIFGNYKFHTLFTSRKNLDIIVINNFCLQRERLSLQSGGFDYQFFSSKIMPYINQRVLQLISALKLFRFLRCRFPRIRSKTLVYFFQIFAFIVKCLEIKFAIHVPHSIIGYRVSDSLPFNFRPAVPLVCGIIAGIGIQEIKEWYFIERSLICGRKSLVIVPRSTETFDAVHYRISPFLILVRKQFFVYSPHSFLYARHRI